VEEICRCCNEGAVRRGTIWSCPRAELRIRDVRRRDIVFCVSRGCGVERCVGCSVVCDGDCWRGSCMHEVEAEVQVILGTNATPRARLPKPGTRHLMCDLQMSSNTCFISIPLSCDSHACTVNVVRRVHLLSVTVECNIEDCFLC
jgi:hypothetical protein